jgi:hypothetical protein
MYKLIFMISRGINFPGGGCIAVAGDGGLRQWQVVNEVNHVAHVPYSFFAIKYVLGNGTGISCPDHVSAGCGVLQS